MVQKHIYKVVDQMRNISMVPHGQRSKDTIFFSISFYFA